MRKTIAMILMLVLVLPTASTIFATDDVKLEGMNPEQSIGNQGVMNLTNQTNDEQVNGLCTDKDTTIYFGDVVPVTSGTNGLHNASIVKTLIIQNWRPNMTPQEGYDLQGAIWYFTDGIIPANPNQQEMIDKALADPNIYPDIYSLLVKNETYLIDNQTTSNTEIVSSNSSSESVIEQIGQFTDSNNVITPDGQVTTETVTIKLVNIVTNTITKTIDHGNKICTETITTTIENYERIITTTITSFFTNTTTDNTTTMYRNTTTTTTDTQYKRTNTTVETWENCLGYLDFSFNSVQKKCKQELILFTVEPRIVKNQYNETYTMCDYWIETNSVIQESFYNESVVNIKTEKFNEINVNSITEPFMVTSEDISWNCVDKPINNTTNPEKVVTANSVPMQATGGPLGLLLGALILIGGTIAYRFRK